MDNYSIFKVEIQGWWDKKIAYGGLSATGSPLSGAGMDTFGGLARKKNRLSDFFGAHKKIPRLWRGIFSSSIISNYRKLVYRLRLRPVNSNRFGFTV